MEVTLSVLLFYGDIYVDHSEWQAPPLTGVFAVRSARRRIMLAACAQRRSSGTSQATPVNQRRSSGAITRFDENIL